MKLFETILVKPILEEMSREKLPEGVLCRVKYPACNIGKRNANNRVYERAVWDKVLEDKDLQEKLSNRALFGHAEHPEQTQSNLELTSHVINKMWIDENKNILYQEFDVLDTPTGRIVDTLLRAECMVGISTRAEGDLEEAEDDTGAYNRVIPDSYKFVTSDFTADPSTFGAVPQNIRRNVVTEIKKLLESKNEEEKEFASCLLNSMKCEDNKCTVEKIDKAVKEKDVEKRHTIEDMVRDELIKVGALVEYKNKKCKVTKIEEGRLFITIPGPEEEGVSIEGCKEVQIAPNGMMIVLPKEDISEPTEVTASYEDGIDMPDEVTAVEQEETKPELEVGMAVETKDGIKGKILSINEGSVNIEIAEGTSIIVDTNKVIITLPEVEGEIPVVEEPEEMETEIPEEEELPVESKVKEAKMGVDYVRTAKASIKVASQALKDKDTDAAVKALEDASDDLADAARAAKKMKRELDAKEEAEAKKEKEATKEKVEEDEVNEGIPNQNMDDLYKDIDDEKKKKAWKKDRRAKEVDEDKVNEGFSVGDTVQIKDKEGNTTIVPKAKVAQKQEVQDGIMSVEITGSKDEDKQEWYSEDEYQIIPLSRKKWESKEIAEKIVKVNGKYQVQSKSGKNMGTYDTEKEAKKRLGQVEYFKHNESKSISSTVKEITDLRILEASTRAERDKAFELLEEIDSANKELEVKILLKKLKEVIGQDNNVITALRTKLEEKAKTVKDIYEKFAVVKSNFNKSLGEIKEAITSAGIKSEKNLSILKESHQREIDKIKEKNIVDTENRVTDIMNSFISQYVKIRVEESGLKVDNNSRALLENSKSLEEVDCTLNEVRDIKRRNALHSESIDKVTISKIVDPEQRDVNVRVGKIFEGFGFKNNEVK